MNQVLHPLIGKCCYVYLDDIVIFSQSVTDHAARLKQVLNRLEEAGLKLKASKCHTGLEQVELFGYVVNAEGICQPGGLSL